MDELTTLLSDLPEPDRLAFQAVAQRAASTIRPSGSTARLDRVASWLAGWQGSDTPTVDRPVLLIAAGDHGVTKRGVSAWPSEVTRAVLDAIRAGAATAPVTAEAVGVVVRVVDAGVGNPTGDITVEPALNPARFRRLFELGREEVRRIDCDLLLLGEVGIGNTTSAAAVAAALFGGDVDGWVGPGAGADEEQLKRKRAAVEKARRRVDGVSDPLEILRELGGSELAVLAGACLEARLRTLPVLLDGMVATTAVAPLEVARPGMLAHCLAAHKSPEPGHGRLLDHLGLSPLLDLSIAVGEGVGALLAVPLIRAAIRMVVDVATFEEWGI